MQCVNFEDSELLTKPERVESGTTEHKPSSGRDRRIWTTVHYSLPSYFAYYSAKRKTTKTKIITSYKNPSFMTPLFWYPESWGAASPVVSKACLIYNNNNALSYQIRKLLITIKDHNRNRKLGKFILDNLKAKPSWVMLNSVYIKKAVSDKTWN